jgi:hypothetical protein
MLAVSRGLDRDRVVDETGAETVVFGRRGSRPFHIDEMQQILRDKDGSILRVEDVRAEDGKVVTKAGHSVADPIEPKKPAPKPIPNPLPFPVPRLESDLPAIIPSATTPAPAPAPAPETPAPAPAPEKIESEKPK